MKWVASVLVTLVLILQAPGHAKAGFLGHNLRDQELFPDTSTVFITYTFLVGPGVEVPAVRGAAISLDVSDTNILFDYNVTGSYTSFPFNGSRIFDFNSEIDPIIGVTINAATNMVGFDASRITFDEDNIFINFQGLPFTPTTLVSLDVQFGSAAVPEPSSLILGGLGAVGLLGYGLRHRKSQGERGHS